MSKKEKIVEKIENEQEMPIEQEENDVEEELNISDAFIESSEDEVNALKVKIVELEAKAESNWDKALRAASDLENVRKRSERELAKAHKYGNEGFVKSLIPVLDSLEQALSVDLDDTSHLREGLELTVKLFLDMLKKHNVQLLDPVGEVFDPALHEAMSTQVSDEKEPGTVLIVFQKGYQLSDRVIRPARVIVSAKPKS